MSELLYRRIYDDIYKKITDGTYKIGTKLPTEYELMRTYSVSRVTAIKALNCLRDDGLIVRSPRVGSLVCGSPEPASQLDIIFIAGVPDEYTPGLREAIRREAAVHGYGVRLSEHYLNHEMEEHYLREILTHGARGVICYPRDGEMANLSLFAAFKEKGIPIVTVDKRVWNPHTPIPCVTTHNRKAMYDLTSYIIGLGHRRIAYCCANFTQANARYRYQGYVEALLGHGIRYDTELVDQLSTRLGSYRSDRDMTEPFLAYLMRLSEPPTALICESDSLAINLMHKAKRLGVRIPEQLSIAGFDNITVSGLLEVPLTTMEQNFSEMGRVAVQTLMRLISGETVEPLTLLDGRLICRSSVIAGK